MRFHQEVGDTGPEKYPRTISTSKKIVRVNREIMPSIELCLRMMKPVYVYLVMLNCCLKYLKICSQDTWQVADGQQGQGMSVTSLVDEPKELDGFLRIPTHSLLVEKY